MDTLLITGAAGLIGRRLIRELRDRFRIRTLDLEPTAQIDGVAEEFVGDIGDRNLVRTAVAGTDAVVHLAGIADEAPYPLLLDVNVLGTYHVLEAVRLEGIPRIVLASTNRVMGLYPGDVGVGIEEPPRPDSFYAASKVAVEALGRNYADRFGLSVVCLRIGSFTGEPPPDRRYLRTWVSEGDLVRAFERAVVHPGVAYEVVYACSNNTRLMWRHNGAAIGFSPQDDAETAVPDPEALPPGVDVHGQLRDHPGG